MTHFVISVRPLVASAPPADDEEDKKKKKRKQYTHTMPADSAAEGVALMLASKKISSKINYDALESLFKDDDKVGDDPIP